MTENNTATPLPAPEGPGQKTVSHPNLTVMPTPSHAAPRQSGLTRRQMLELTGSREIAGVAQQPEYAEALRGRGVPPEFVATLAQDIERALQQGRSVTGAQAARSDATQQQADTRARLVSGLQSVQATARQQHLPEHAALLKKYHVGEKLQANRPKLEAVSQNIIEQADAERPGGIDTTVIVNLKADRAAFLAAVSAKSAETGRSKQARATRDELVRSIVARRKKIQYTADALWPPGRPESAQARSDFTLPATRPYSY